jgi:hypothetical protein
MLRLMPKRAFVCFLAAFLALALPATAGASDTTLARTLAHWSQRIGADSKRQQAVSSGKSSPLAQVKAATTRVLNDAISAGKALAREKPSTRGGARVKSLSVEAFELFARGERELLSSLDATGRADPRDARAHAAKAMVIVVKAARILLEAGRLANQL